MKDAIQIELDLQKSQKNTKSFKRLTYAKEIIATTLKKKDKGAD